MFFFQPSFHEANDGIGKTKDQENQCQSCTFQIPMVHIEDFKGWKKWVKLAHLHHQQSSCWDQDFLIFHLLMDQKKQSLTKLDCISDRISFGFFFLRIFGWQKQKNIKILRLNTQSTQLIGTNANSRYLGPTKSSLEVPISDVPWNKKNQRLRSNHNTAIFISQTTDGQLAKQKRCHSKTLTNTLKKTPSGLHLPLLNATDF